jgi:CheY-like chemotaxis protein
MTERGRRILVVDDDPTTLLALNALMTRRGHEVTVAEDGEEGLRVALEIVPELIVTDVMMPVMDGFSFVRRVRSEKALALVPVIFLTSLDTAEDRIRGFRLGADDYLAKPFNAEELVLRVDKVLGHAARLHGEVERMTRGDDAGAGFVGSLQELGLGSLLMLLEMERKSGMLAVDGRIAGRIFFAEGRPVDAFVGLEGEGARGTEAVYEMLTWSMGRFEFNGVDVAIEDVIRKPASFLLLEAARLMDEARGW